MTARHDHDEAEHQEPIVRDRRRIDPTTGSVRPPVAEAADPGGPAPAGDNSARPAPSAEQAASPQLDALRAQLAERTADLQRLQAEFANFRKRVERDKQAVAELALANVLANLLPVLDDLGRAREHGELEGGFKSVADALEATVGKLGLSSYGEAGEPFDPTVHEALTHAYSGDVGEPTCVAVLQPGYRLGARVLRPARVAVAEPSTDAEPTDE